MKYDLLIGIDTGVNTGIAVYDKDKKKLLAVDTVAIHVAMQTIEDLAVSFKIKVRFEDARLRKWFADTGREKLQGAGSVKRDAKIWEDYLKDKGIDFEPIAPKNNKTKLNVPSFRAMTKWMGITTEHGRDAAMLVYGF